MIMLFFAIGPLLAIFIILIPLIKSIVRFNRFMRGQQGPTPLQAHTETYDLILDDVEAESEDTAVHVPPVESWEFPEILFMGIAPILGIVLVYTFYSDIKPFNLAYAPTLGAYILVGYISYWLSRYAKGSVSIAVAALLPYGIIIGIGLYLALLVHFVSALTLLGGAIFPYLAFPLFAPLPAILYSIRELKRLLPYLHENLKVAESDFEQQSDANQFAGNILWVNSLQNWGILFIFIFIIQLALYFTGQPFDALWLAFREGSEFLFSKNGPF